ncbi:MAG: ABC transporter ATP-binding protein [Thermodesulfovibrionales bacterium]|jgi:cobalt/nickel transport system ATP-binding protein
MENPIIQLDKIRYSYYGNIPALLDISLDIRKGEKLAIIGANGSGKSTLLQIMDGLIHPSQGRVLFRGQEVSERSLRDREFVRFFRQRVGYVFQDSDIQLFCPTVMDELLFGPLHAGIEEGAAVKRAEEVMEMLEIKGLRERPSSMLSGGEKKRVALGSVLTMNPEVLLLDEPTNGLDPRTQCFLMELILALSDAGKTIVISTHDLALVDELHPQVAVLSEAHRIEGIGSSDEILRDNDLLLRVNLVHEHMHSHGDMAHKHIHSHYLFHKHKEAGSMQEMEKLEKLLLHWKEHNDEHAEVYRDWAGKASAQGKAELAAILDNLCKETKKLNSLFDAALKTMQEN